MVGIDEHTYSDYALEYLLSRLVDNGDHIVCVTVMEKDVRNLESSYRDRARALMSRVLRKNYAMSDSAINVTVEYAVGKLHNTFQRLVGCQSLLRQGPKTNNRVVVDSDLPAWDADRGNTGPVWGYPGANGDSKLLLEVLPPVFPYSSCRGTAR